MYLLRPYHPMQIKMMVYFRYCCQYFLKTTKPWKGLFTCHGVIFWICFLQFFWIINLYVQCAKVTLININHYTSWHFESLWFLKCKESIILLTSSHKYLKSTGSGSSFLATLRLSKWHIVVCQKLILPILSFQIAECRNHPNQYN